MRLLLFAVALVTTLVGCTDRFGLTYRNDWVNLDQPLNIDRIQTRGYTPR
jgi:hypothetical protein